MIYLWAVRRAVRRVPQRNERGAIRCLWGEFADCAQAALNLSTLVTEELSFTARNLYAVFITHL